MCPCGNPWRFHNETCRPRPEPDGITHPWLLLLSSPRFRRIERFPDGGISVVITVGESGIGPFPTEHYIGECGNVGAALNAAARRVIELDGGA